MALRRERRRANPFQGCSMPSDTNPKRDQRATHTWFDAFRTLKFVHAARHEFPDPPLLTTLETLYPAAHTPARLNASLRADEARMQERKGLG